MKRLSFMELLYAALVWAIKRADRVEMDMESMKGYMGHLAYMCMHATTNNYTDEAYRGYDGAIREKAKEKGLRAFKMGDNGLSLLHFNLDNSRGHKAVKKGRSGSSGKPGKQAGEEAAGASTQGGPCYGHNYKKEGCKRKKCCWDHKCIACGSTEHVIGACPSRKF